MNHIFSAHDVWVELIRVMQADNGCTFRPSIDHYQESILPIWKLLAAGYFKDNPNDLDGSFWQCAAGEETEAKEYFNREPEAYATLSNILNRIFNGEE